ncbi:putative pyridoxal kinase [Ascosphaera atra]|nr:putative pyridoxal kinase [Ascosphaera atra]
MTHVHHEESDDLVPETKVLAVASHVSYGFVGNTMATFVMQSLGCDVTAINTVNFSNHAGYRQLKGTRCTADEVRSLYQGICESYLDDFDVMLSGYAPGAAVVEAVGDIASDLRKKADAKGEPGSFFWALDPVMGDQGRLYVNEDVVPAYKKMLPYADLILPNQFEAEILSGIRITSLNDLAKAIAIIHKQYSIPHIIVTSVQLPTISISTDVNDNVKNNPASPDQLTIIGSTARSDMSPRLFKIQIPRLDCFFSGTGDMFAALTIARLREAVANDADKQLRQRKAWVPRDDVSAVDLPLAKATGKVLGSMHGVLERTMEARNQELEGYYEKGGDEDEFQGLSGEEKEAAVAKRKYLRETKAAEVRLVRNVRLLKRPDVVFKAQEWSG